MCRRDCFERFQPFFVALALALTVASHAGAAAMYRVTDLGPNDYYGLNDLGQTIGTSRSIAGELPDQLITTNGQAVDLGPSVSLQQTHASGQMLQVNYGHDASGHPTIDYLIREPNGSTHLIAGIAAGEQPLAINDAGQVLVSTGEYPPATFSVLTEGQRRTLLTVGGNISRLSVSAFGPHGEISGLVDQGTRSIHDTYSFSATSTMSYTSYSPSPNDVIKTYNGVGGFISNGQVYGSQGLVAPHGNTIHAEALNNAGVAVGNLLTAGF